MKIVSQNDSMMKSEVHNNFEFDNIAREREGAKDRERGKKRARARERERDKKNGKERFKTERKGRFSPYLSK